MSIKTLFTLLLIFGFFTTVRAQSSDKGQPTPEQGLVRSVQLFPNPADEYLFVKLESLDASKVKLTVCTIIGNEMTVETDQSNDKELRVKVKDLASGYYLLTVKESGSKFRGTYKFLKR